MPTTLTTNAVEQSTYIITAAFTDEDGNAEDVKTLTWSLTDGHGNVINSRSDVTVTAPGSSENIVLSGDDLALFGDDDDGARVVTVEATYDSDNGSDMPLKDKCSFTVVDLDSVS